MTDETATTNKRLLRDFYREVFGSWNMAPVDDVVSAEFVSHDWPENGPRGPHAFKDYYNAMRSAVPDGRYEVDDLIADGDKVVVRWRLVGTHDGDYAGIAATHRPITLKGIAIYRVQDGKLMERWVVSDVYGALKDVRNSAPH